MRLPIAIDLPMTMQYNPKKFLVRIRLLAPFVAVFFLLAVAGCSKMNTEAQSTKSVTPPPIQYRDAWGSRGSEPGHLDQPTSIASDALGNIFIADAGSRFIHKFDAQGVPLFSFQDEWIKDPQSIAVDRGGGIYAADAARGTVSVFFPGGDRYRDIKLRSRLGEEDILAVTVADDGMVFVLDNNAREVFAYSDHYRLLQTWHPFTTPADARNHSAAIASGGDGYVYFLDAGANRIVRYTEEGRVVSEFFVRPASSDRKLGDQFAVAGGYIFAMDGDGVTLHVLTSDGKPKLDFDLTPQLGQQSRFIPPLAVSPHHELFVLDAPNSRVLRYRLNF